MSNPFESYGDAATVAPTRRREQRRDSAMALKAKKQLDEQAYLLKGYNSWVKERREALLAGPFGKECKALNSILRTMTPSSAPALISFIQKANWLKEADADTRHEVLAMVSNGITRVRLNAGLPPFDDATPGEPDNAFLIIRDHIQNT